MTLLALVILKARGEETSNILEAYHDSRFSGTWGPWPILKRVS